MSNIKSIIENIQQEDLVNAKDLIKQELLNRLGNLLESAIEDIAPSMISEEEKQEEEPKKKSSVFVTRKKQNEDEDDNKKKSKSMRKESFEQEEAINDIDADTSEEFEDFIDQVHQIVQEIEEETGEQLTEDEIIVIGQEYLELLNEDLPGNQEAIDVAEPKGKITGADFKKLRSNKKGK
jgi:hypothetical protein